MTEPIRLLLIEDSDVEREMVLRLLDSRYAVDQAATGVETMPLIEARHYDVVLLDYRLPDVDGLHLLTELIARELPVVMLTIEERPDIIIKAMQCGAQDYLVKRMLTSSRLHQSLSNAMDRARLRRETVQQQQQLEEQAATLLAQYQQIQNLASDLTLAEQRERRRIARVLHDHLQQLLHGLQMRLLIMHRQIDNPAALQSHLREMEVLAEEAIVATRTLTVEISPPVLHGEGLGKALRWLAAQMQQINGLHVDLDIDSDEQRLDEDRRVLVFQLVRELLFNVVKHAGVDRAKLAMYEDGSAIVIVVSDAGQGFDASVSQDVNVRSSGYGLFNIQHRLELLNGRFTIESEPGKGTVATIRIPKG